MKAAIIIFLLLIPEIIIAFYIVLLFIDNCSVEKDPIQECSRDEKHNEQKQQNTYVFHILSWEG